MGGTYWYFYRMDDDIEFHNSAEPSTTQCPLLPGQIVNVLDMPALLSGNRSRNPSISSTSSEKRTMNPSDKFMNPRPAPAKPELPRLQTSPTLVGSKKTSSESAPSSILPSRSASKSNPPSQPDSSTTMVRVGRSPRNHSADRANRSASPRAASASGMRSAFRHIKTARSNSRIRSPEPEARDRETYFEIDGNSLPEANDPVWRARSQGSSRETSPANSRRGREDHDLVFRRPRTGSDGSIGPITVSSFEQHRRQRSRSRTPSSLRNSMTSDDINVSVPVDFGGRRMQPLGTLKEVPSTQNTPAAPLTGELNKHEEETIPNLEKRLPTLPNTPSSAYPPSSARATTTSLDQLEMANLQSHFSCTTIDTSTSEEPSLMSASTHFSNWSTEDSATMPNSGHTDTSLIESEPMSGMESGDMATPRDQQPHQRYGDASSDDGVTPQRSLSQRDMTLTTTCSSSTISSTTASSLASSPSQYVSHDDHWQQPLHHMSSVDRFQYQHYRLPADDYGSEVTLKQPTERLKTEADMPPAPPPSAALVGIRRQDTADNTQQAQTGIPHSTTMQQLINELSYLGDMINQQ